MATAFDTSQNVLSKNGYGCNRPRARLLGRLNFGPRFNEDVITVTRSDTNSVRTKEFSLCYRVYNPSSIHSTESPPLVVIHGGPSLPSDYLYPIIQHFPSSRSVIFYDQLGCGRSSQPEDVSMYSIEDAVHDLEDLLHSLQLNSFHLLGHSFGGIVAYELAKANGLHSSASKCLSLTLDSTPDNMKTSLEECSRLENEVKSELTLEDNESQEACRLVQDRLRKRNECRTDVMPDSLVTAIESRGTTFGPEAVKDYVAYPPVSRSLPPVLLIRGQYDFVTEKCMQGWRKIFAEGSCSRAYREEEMSNCAHYCHLEDAQSFGELIKSHCFINDY